MMAGKKKIARKSAVETPSDSLFEAGKELDLRKSSYIKAVQSDRITVLVGPTKRSFQLPEDLLSLHSCRSGFKGFWRRIIELPDVKVSTFEDFFIWVHATEPSIDSKCLETVLDLAIFAEMHIICHLKNQTSDILRARLGDNQWSLTPRDVSMVYDSVPSGSILRQLCSVSLALSVRDRPFTTFGRTSSNLETCHRQHTDHLEWKATFEKHSDLGWDYFREIQTSDTQAAIGWGGGPCRFHDHRDVPDVGCLSTDTCPYPHGALPISRTGSLPHENGEYRPEDEVPEDEVPVDDESPVDEESPMDEEPMDEEPMDDGPDSLLELL